MFSKNVLQLAAQLSLSILPVRGSAPFVARHPTAFTSGNFVRDRDTASRRRSALLRLQNAADANVRGPVLRPSSSSAASSEERPAVFDEGCVAHPVVLPPSADATGTDLWQMYYYGNPGTWANGTKCFLPTGYVGLAESADGIHWEKVAGSEDFGSILAPTGRTDDWDGLHVGVGDVVRVGGEGGKELHMYYFGGSFEELSFGGGGPPAKGFRMRIGRARSTDEGRSWERMGRVLDIDDDEGFFASWPKIIASEEGGGPWRMLYHAFNGTRWAAFEARSADEGATWTREGKMALGPGEASGWDGSGVGTRAVAREKGGDLVVVYEAVEGSGGPFAGRHRLGLARWDEAGGVWEKDTAISGVPGGPILEPGVEPLEPWTAHVIGTPCLVPMDDGSMRLYFCSKKDNDMRMHIGLVESKSGDLSPSSWKPISPM